MVEAAWLLRDRFLATEVWETLGIPLDDGLLDSSRSPMLQLFQRVLFAKITPNLRKIGLLSPRLADRLVAIGAMAPPTSAAEQTPGVPPRPPDVSFDAAVERVLRRLRTGEVVTYGEVAAEAGFPGASRAVGSWLARSGGEVSWWRVVTSTGRLVPHHEAEHARRLRAEGVEVDEAAGRVRLGARRG